MTTTIHDTSQWQANFDRYKDIPIEDRIERKRHFMMPFINFIKQHDEINKILEIGVGSGLGTLTLSREFPDKTFEVVDIDVEVIKYVKLFYEKYNQKIKVTQADAFDLPYLHQEFDLAFSSGLIEHYDTLESVKLLKEHRRVGKWVYFDVPLRYWFLLYKEKFNKEGGYGDERRKTQEQ